MTDMVPALWVAAGVGGWLGVCALCAWWINRLDPFDISQRLPKQED